MLNIFMNYTLNFYTANLQHSVVYIEHLLSIRVENSVNPDQMASSEITDLGLKCFFIMDKAGSAGQGFI